MIVGKELLQFVSRGGQIRLICSPSLDERDVESIESGLKSPTDKICDSLIADFERLLEESATSYRAKVLATLVSIDALKIKIALRPQASGLFHEKVGIFTDEFSNSVSFMGSSNETWNGWHFNGNHEAIEVFCSWREGSDLERVRRHSQYFERLWNGMVTGVNTLEFPKAVLDKVLSASLGKLEDIDDSLIAEAKGNQGDSMLKTRAPLPHQLSAINAWEANDSRGILEHATGSGKTYTAIIQIKKHLTQGHPVIVLVPSKLLLSQWIEELGNEIPDAIILPVGGGNTRWKSNGRLKAMTYPIDASSKRVTVATMQTASSTEFLNNVVSGSHLLLVADEVHQTGSAKNSRIFSLEAGKRLGLSATPTRYGDPEGTRKIVEYFGGIVPPPYTLKDAIRDGRLVQYEYFPKVIHLTAEEAENWKELTLRIVREMIITDKDATQGALSERVKMLLIQRSRIAKKAKNKVSLAAEILGNNFKEGDRWLVYCEDSEQVSEVLSALRNEGLLPLEYHMAMVGDKEATLTYFKQFGGILVSIKCLDEGVDIPSIDHGLILASSQNPRQFIQRRGRVLRVCANKHHAVIYDALVAPINIEDEPEQTSLLRSELGRAIEFAESALNLGAAAQLRAIAIEAGFDPDILLDAGIEETEDS